MTESAVVFSSARDSLQAAAELSAKISDALHGERPDAVVLFAAPSYDQPALLGAINERVRPEVLIGASSAGEFTNEQRGEGMACALALRSSDLKFSAGIGRGLRSDRREVARAITSSFRGFEEEHPYRAALVMTDALAGHADDLVDELTLATQGKYQFFGGGAGDNAQFRRTNVFFGNEAVSDAAVALEILSRKPIGVGVGHGWEPASAAMRVTEADGMKLVSLNGMPAVDAFERHAQATLQTLDIAAPIPFFLQNILGVDTGAGFRLRVPLVIHPDGAVSCAAEIPVGSKVHIMRTTAESASAAAASATSSALAGLKGNAPKVALFFDCVATRLRLREVFGHELKSVSEALGGAQFAGCNTHGQIARSEGQFGGFHNCTAVVCVLPE